ncbi:carbohydrate sulfotransferase 8-like isoform X2 [Lates japonicus]|uniref:Carbohydrate sulfotransferase 8-like isoform X2 n=1 Tax=Lates japonicus TaxID=270547 RepID=A0AAD3NGL6_LATJO|nr:carbohydrate sulfotransferase 8-like isoform X2 [Lates japonicus]
MLWMKWKMVVDSLHGRRRRLSCSRLFLLLFAAGGLILFIHQQDLLEMVQQQGSAKQTDSSPHWVKGDCYRGDTVAVIQLYT